MPASSTGYRVTWVRRQRMTISNESRKDVQADVDSPRDASTRVTARALLGRRVWLSPLVIGSVFIALVAAVYIGSVINPTGHLHGLPVMVVDEDAGGSAGGHEVNVGASVVHALRRSPAVAGRLGLHVSGLGAAHLAMNEGHAYATLVIPRTFTRSVLETAGAPGQDGTGVPPRAAISLEENQRLGSLGVNLAAGVVKPAIEKVSSEVGRQLSALAPSKARSNTELAAGAADPITLETVTYRPLPDHSALGLSAFYIALLSILAGFIAGPLTNSSIDSVLGYTSSELGPHWKLRRPVPIARKQILLAKLGTALLVVPVLTA